MQVSVETTHGLERRMTVAVPAERIEQEVQNRLKSLARTAKLDGFRPGKAPLSLVQRRFGGKVRQEVVGEVVQSTFYEALVQEKLRLAGGPRIEPRPASSQQTFEYVATFEVYPDVRLAPLEGLQVERPASEVTEQDVDSVIQKLRHQRQTWSEVQRAAESGDQVTIDYRGTLSDGATFEGNEGQGVPLVLGSGSFVEGFEAALVGASAGDEREVNVNFPASYRHREVANKPVYFQVKVHGVAEPVLPSVDEQFAEAFGVAQGGVDALRQQVRERLEKELAQAVRARIKQHVMDALLAANPLELPTALVKGEIEQLRQQMAARFGPEASTLPDNLFESQAGRRVALGLLLAELVRSQNLKADPAAVRAYVEAVAADYEKPEEVIQWYYSSKERLTEVEVVVIEDLVVERVLAQAQVVDKQTTFDALTKSGQTEQG